MALPASGTLALTDIATEFGDTAPHSMSEFYRGGGKVPDSAGNSAVPASGAINIGGFYNAANRAALAFTIASDTQNYNLYTQASGSPSYVAGTTDLTLTINSGVNVGSSSTGAYALSVPSQFTSGDTISIVNNGTVISAGGAGGLGAYTGDGFSAPQAQSTPGSPAGNALYVQYATTITNNGTVASGGGGGGGAGIYWTPGSPPGHGGGGGGGGAGYSGGSGGAGRKANVPPAFGFVAGNPGSPGTLTAGGAGGYGAGGPTPPTGAKGGNGGGRGASGGAGASHPYPPGIGAGKPGGVTGNYLVGDSFVTWAATGTRIGGVS